MEISLHPRQAEVFSDPARFKLVAAGRRFGKSWLGVAMALVEASKNTKERSDGVEWDLGTEQVFYVGPTFDQTKRNVWPLFKLIGADIIRQKWENTGDMELINGRRIGIKGTDREDNIRGVGLSFVVMDEYAYMKGSVWEEVIEPALMAAEGGALFIGTPEGKNHFYELWLRGKDPEFPEWRSWTFYSMDNPFLPEKELEARRKTMTKEGFEQEVYASFEAGGGLVMTPGMFPIVENIPYPCDMYMAVDLAGFTTSSGGRKVERRDNHAIVIVAVHARGWCVVDVQAGRWDVRETALRIVKAFKDWRPVRCGLEKGMARMAVLPYLKDEQARLGIFFEVEELSHSNQRKQDRIAWALQGRAEKGRVQLLEAEWNRKFLEEVTDFPNPTAHDDIIDATAYIDQIAEPWFEGPTHIDEWQPIDEYAGY